MCRKTASKSYLLYNIKLFSFQKWFARLTDLIDRTNCSLLFAIKLKVSTADVHQLFSDQSLTSHGWGSRSPHVKARAPASKITEIFIFIGQSLFWILIRMTFIYIYWKVIISKETILRNDLGQVYWRTKSSRTLFRKGHKFRISKNFVHHVQYTRFKLKFFYIYHFVYFWDFRIWKSK